MTISRRSFLAASAFGAGLLAQSGPAEAREVKIKGFEDTKTDVDKDSQWRPVSDRKIRMGLAGYGVCRFATQFSLQNHPNVEIVAVSDLFQDRCDALAKAAKCSKTYPSVEEMVKDDHIEAIFLGTDAASHGRLAMEVLNHGKHVGVAVPAVLGDIEQAHRLYETVKKNSGLNYMMFETSTFHDSVYAMREIYRNGGFGRLIYSEGEYYHYGAKSTDSYNGWRQGLPPMFYPTHGHAYYVCVTGKSFVEVSARGWKSEQERFRPENNPYKNPFGTEVALYRTSEGGMARMAEGRDTPGYGAETGRVSGEKGSYWQGSYQGTAEGKAIVAGLNLKKQPLPPTVVAGGHGGSHGYLGNEFVMSILENRKPLVNIAWALNMTVAGITSHQSALKDGELMKIPQFEF